MRSAKIFVDGASRGNPGEASIGISIQNASGEEIAAISKRIGKATNNMAEYSALVVALAAAKDQHIETVAVFSDSELMVRQMKGEYKVKDTALKLKWAEAKKLVETFRAFSIAHVRRELNRRADELANQALDSE